MDGESPNPTPGSIICPERLLSRLSSTGALTSDLWGTGFRDPSAVSILGRLENERVSSITTLFSGPKGSWMLMLVFSRRLFMVPSIDLIEGAFALEIRSLSLLDGKEGRVKHFFLDV